MHEHNALENVLEFILNFSSVKILNNPNFPPTIFSRIMNKYIRSSNVIMSSTLLNPMPCGNSFEIPYEIWYIVSKYWNI